jgi:hypothetical protein
LTAHAPKPLPFTACVTSLSELLWNTLDAELAALAGGPQSETRTIQAAVARNGLIIADPDFEGAALQRRAVQHNRQPIGGRDLRLERHLQSQKECVVAIRFLLPTPSQRLAR